VVFLDKHHENPANIFDVALKDAGKHQPGQASKDRPRQSSAEWFHPALLQLLMELHHTCHSNRIVFCVPAIEPRSVSKGMETIISSSCINICFISFHETSEHAFVFYV
jgi:hypothetical protein